MVKLLYTLVTIVFHPFDRDRYQETNSVFISTEPSNQNIPHAQIMTVFLVSARIRSFAWTHPRKEEKRCPQHDLPVHQPVIEGLRKHMAHEFLYVIQINVI